MAARPHDARQVLANNRAGAPGTKTVIRPRAQRRTLCDASEALPFAAGQRYVERSV